MNGLEAAVFGGAAVNVLMLEVMDRRVVERIKIVLMEVIVLRKNI